MSNLRSRFSVCSILGVLVASSLAVIVPLNVSDVRAATITVNTLTDVTNGSDGLTTLREAITAATTGDIIEFSSSLFTSGPQTLEITDHFSICCKGLFEVRGPGRDLLTIRGPRSDRTMTGYSISNNVLTVTLSSAPVFTANVGGLQGRVIIYGANIPIVGEHIVTGVSGNTFTANYTAADVAFTAASATVLSPIVSSSTHWGLAGRFMEVTSNVKVTNMTIEGFHAERGGAFHVKSSATLYLDNVRIRKTGAFDWSNCGGAIKADRGHLDIRNSIFVENIGKCDGAINMGDGNGTTMYIANTTFQNNIANNGWAITSYLPAEIVNSTVTGTVNYAGQSVSSFYMAGIAMPLTIDGSNFEGAGAVYINNASSSNISNSTFTTSSGTAALRLGHTYATLTGNTVQSCSTEAVTGLKISSGNTFSNNSTCDSASAPNGAKVTTYSRTSNVVTMNTATSHGFSAGDSVRLCGLQAFSTSCSYTMTVASAPSGTSFTFAHTGSDLGSTNAVSESARGVWVFEPTAVGPGAPTITSVTPGSSQAVVAWSSGTSGTSSITDYIIQYSEDGGSWTTFNDGVGTSTSRTVTGLTNGSSYRFRVAAVTSVETGSYSSASTAVTVGTQSTSTTSPSTSTTSPSTSSTSTSTSVPSSSTTGAPSLTSPTTVVTNENPAVDSEATGDSSDRSESANAPRAASTTSTSSTTTTVPAPNAPEAEPGAVAATVNGQVISGTISRSNNRLLVVVAGISATIFGVTPNGDVVALDDEGNLRLEKNDLISIEAAGFSPGVGVELWIFSTPFSLAEVTAGSDGKVSGTYPLPTTVEPGSHRVVLKGVDQSGDEVVAGVGLFIGQPFIADGVSPWLIWVPVSVAVAFALIIPATRRRRKLRETPT